MHQNTSILSDLMSERTVMVEGVRKLRVVEGGDPRGRPVLYMHGSPGSSFLDPTWEDDARRQGIRLIGYDRPGYGGSAPFPGRRVVDAVADVTAIADQLGLSRFALWGVSGGGPHALACAARLSSRCAAVASLASPAPPEFGDGPRTTRVNKEVSCEPLSTPEERQRWMAARREKDLRAARSMLPVMEVLGSERRSLKRGLYRLLTPMAVGRAEARALSPEVARWFAASVREALQQGIDAGLDDLIAIYHQPWGFDLASIRVPVLLWHGEKDQFVRVSEGRWLARRVPNVETRFTPKDGHISLTWARIPEVHRWLLSRLKAPVGPASQPAGQS